MFDMSVAWWRAKHAGRRPLNGKWSGTTLHTPPLHGKRRTLEAELGEKLGRPIATSTQYPRDLGIGAYGLLDEATTDAPTAMRRRHNQHGEVTIGLAVCDGPHEANDLTFNDSHVGDLRCFDKRAELLKASNTLMPTIRGEKLMCTR